MTMTTYTNNTELRRSTFPQAPDLGTAYEEGGWLVLIGRNSTANGAKGREQAIKDLRRAAEGLASHGLDARPLLPSDKELNHRLAETVPERSSDKKGKPFSNIFVEFTIPELRVLVLLSTGTARKVDDEDGLQPFVNRLERILSRQNIVAVYCKRIDRLTRNAWAFAAAMRGLVEGWVGDNGYGFRRVSGLDSILIFFSALQGEMEADTLAVKSREGRVDATGTAMVNGQVGTGVSINPPAGLGRARRRNAAGAPGRSVLYLDDERWRPDRASVVYGLAESIDGSSPVSQVENVRFALQHLGQPGWGMSSVAKALSARGFSTLGYRSVHGLTASFPAGRRADIVLGSILSNLDFYETGRLVITVDKGESLYVNIEGCIPPDGPWATPADFARIRNYLAQGGMRFDGMIRLTLAGLKLIVNDVECKLVTADRKPRTKPPTAYRVMIDAESNGKSASMDVPHVDAASINDTIATSLIDAADKAFEFVPISVEPSDRQHDMSRQLSELRAELAHLRERALDLKERVLENASLACTAILQELAADYEVIVKQSIPALEINILRLEGLMEEEVRIGHSGHGDLKATALAHLLATLRDPGNTTYARLLKDALVNPRLTITPRALGGHELSFHASIQVSGDAGAATIPIDAAWTQGRAEGPGVRQVLEALAAGTPYKDIEVTAAESLLVEICQHLGVQRKDCLFLNVTDSRVLRVGMAVTHNRCGRSDDEIASNLREPLELVRRVAKLWGAPKRSAHWLRTAPSCVFGRIHVVASAGGGFASDAAVAAVGISVESANSALRGFSDVVRVQNGWSIVQCRWCGTSQRAVSRLHEVDTSICLGCRCDRSGVEWAADPYDGYLVNLSDLIIAGLVEERPAISTSPARWKARGSSPRGAKGEDFTVTSSTGTQLGDGPAEATTTASATLASTITSTRET